MAARLRWMGDGLIKTPMAMGACIGLALLGPTAGITHPLPLAAPASTTTIVVPESGGVATVRSITPTVTKQQVEIFRGISQSTAGSRQLSMNRIVLKPGTRGLRHQHQGLSLIHI